MLEIKMFNYTSNTFLVMVCPHHSLESRDVLICLQEYTSSTTQLDKLNRNCGFSREAQVKFIVVH